MIRPLILTIFAWAVLLPTSDRAPGCPANPPAEAQPGTWMVFVDRTEPPAGSWVGACHPVGSHLGWNDDLAPAEPFWRGERPATPCEVRAYEMRGPFLVRSPPRIVDEPAPGAQQVLVLELPPGPTGGIGVGFDVEPAGMRVLTVHEGTPAEGLLEPGDLLVAVNGTATAGMTAWEFTDLSLGVAGTSVDVDLLRSGQAIRHTFTRSAYVLDR